MMQLSIPELLRDNPNLCCSGRAIGYDTVWGDAALDAGHNVVHFVFEGHAGTAGGHTVQLTRAQLDKAIPFLQAANRVLQRRFPARDAHVNDLLKRNYYQIYRTHAVYAVAPIDADAGLVEGGTGWAVQMYADRMGRERDGALYVFDEKTTAWYTWKNAVAGFCPATPPPPRGIYTGIGSRKTTPAGVRALRQLFET